jgi:ankyrin repeat protein
MNVSNHYSGFVMGNLNECLFNGAIETAKQFLENGADINARGENGRYPISSAIASENPIVLNFVISNGADVNINLGNGWTPLHEAFDAAVDGMVQNNEDRPSKETIEIISLLIKSGADIERRDFSGKTPLDALNTYSNTKERFNFFKSVFRDIIPSVDDKITFKGNS